jgi:glycosyltransferase involved in cell wall biosynthesis
VPNGVELKTNESGAASEVRARRCISLARLAPDKNVLSLAIAAAEVAGGGDFHVDFYGRGCLQEELENTLRLASNPAVSYKGWVKDTSSVLPNYGYVLLPSKAEGLSNAMIEAMANGVVPIATRLSGFVDHIIPGQNGFFFESDNCDAIKRGLRMIAAIPTEEWNVLSSAARDYAKRCFDLRMVCSEYIALYLALTSTRLEGALT